MAVAAPEEQAAIGTNLVFFGTLLKVWGDAVVNSGDVLNPPEL
jgi:hypothetical protein